MMKSNPLPIMAVLLVCASVAHPQDVDGAKQAREIIDHAKATGKAAEKLSLCATSEESYSLTPENCQTLHKVERLLGPLLSAADFSRGRSSGQIQFYLDMKRGDDVIFYEEEGADAPNRGARYLVIGKGWLNRKDLKDTVIAESLSHEIGHGVQHRDLSVKERASYTSRQLESHADLIGAQIAVRAGYSLDQIQMGRESSNCGAIVEGFRDDADHASAQDRWVNTLLTAEAISRMKSPSKADGQSSKADGALDPSKPFKMLASPGIFDEDGRLLTALEHTPKIKDDQFMSLVSQAWTDAGAMVKDQLLNDQQIRSLVVQACGTPEAHTLRSAVAEALANPKHVVRVPIPHKRSPPDTY